LWLGYFPQTLVVKRTAASLGNLRQDQDEPPQRMLSEVLDVDLLNLRSIGCREGMSASPSHYAFVSDGDAGV